MTQQEFDNLPMGATLYYVCVDEGDGATIEYVKKGEDRISDILRGMCSTTKQGAIIHAINNYSCAIRWQTEALKSVTELMKKYL